MRINHNIASLNTYRQLGTNSTNSQKNIEKLSSGLRINRAGDDAAGLAISEKMRGQIRGLDMASRNAQDGISLIQTAEGALNETHSILQRMRELAVQSSNDTNTTTDRAELQKEVDQLSQELSRIGTNTEFNTQALLDGSFDGTFQIGANESQNLYIKVADMRGFTLGMAGKVEVQVGATYTAATGTDTEGTGVANSIVAGEYSITGTAGDYKLVDADNTEIATSTDGQNFTGKGTDGASTGASTETLVLDSVVTSGKVTIAADGTATASYEISNTGLQAGEYSVNASNELVDSSGTVIATFNDTDDVYETADGTAVFEAAAALAEDTVINVGGIDISSQTDADDAITKIQTAIETVSAERSKLGAYQNRLEHTINNLGTSAENLTAAESRIRDVDMAKEMMEFTKNNILSQAAQAMLAQANQQPQGVLQLLR